MGRHGLGSLEPTAPCLLSDIRDHSVAREARGHPRQCSLAKVAIATRVSNPVGKNTSEIS